MDNNFNYIFPFCLYHYLDKTTNTYLSSINRAIKYKEGDKISVKCSEDSHPENWHFAGQIYSIDPSLVPRPFGLEIFVVIQRRSFPFDVFSVKLVTDIFNEVYKLYDKEFSNSEIYKTTFFTAWTFPLSNTTPLYFFKTNRRVFISFDPIAPPSDNHNPMLKVGFTDRIHYQSSKNNKFEELIGTLNNVVSPVYVLSDDTFKDGFENIKFQCIDGTLLPYKGTIPNLFSYFPIGEPLPINKALIDCNVAFKHHSKEGSPYSLKQIIKLLSEEKPTNKKLSTVRNNNTKKSIVVPVMVILIFFSVCIISYFIWKKFFKQK
jgi:hypothetical protein